MPAKGHDDRFLLVRKYSGVRLLCTGLLIPHMLAPFPLGNGFLVYSVAPRQGSQTFLLRYIARRIASVVVALPCKT